MELWGGRGPGDSLIYSRPFSTVRSVHIVYTTETISGIEYTLRYGAAATRAPGADESRGERGTGPDYSPAVLSSVGFFFFSFFSFRISWNRWMKAAAVAAGGPSCR